MAELVTLTDDCQFGSAGSQVWVNDPKDVKAVRRETKAETPKPAAPKQS